MSDILEHKMKRWEIKYGYLSIKGHSEWRGFFRGVLNKNFDLNIFGEKIYERKIDAQGRIYVGPASLKSLTPDETVLIVRDEKGNLYVKKK
ncbi:MAG: hypothetical protein QXZ70_07125 [Candidatus Bathyarchaeia archaeon]